MREDPGVDVITAAIVVFGALVSVSEAFRSGADNPNWELRWRGLDPEYRDWLAAMTTSGRWLAKLEDPLEVELAAGFARRERRRMGYLDLVAAALLAFGLALSLFDLLPRSDLSFALSLYFGLRAAAFFLRNHQIRRRLTERSDSEAAPPRQGGPLGPRPQEAG